MPFRSPPSPDWRGGGFFVWKIAVCLHGSRYMPPIFARMKKDRRIVMATIR